MPMRRSGYVRNPRPKEVEDLIEGTLMPPVNHRTNIVVAVLAIFTVSFAILMPTIEDNHGDPEDAVQDFEFTILDEPVAPLSEAANGTYITNSPVSRTFSWGPPVRSAREAFMDTFPDSSKWQAVTFKENPGRALTVEATVEWVEQELLGGLDPFHAFGGVPVPFSSPGYEQAQIAPGQFVGYSRRQLCYIVAMSLMGAPTQGYFNGLLRFMNERVQGTSIFVPSQAGQVPRKGGFGEAWWYMLATCAADPGLANGNQGSLVVAATAGPDLPSVQDVRILAQSSSLHEVNLRVCRYDDGSNGDLSRGMRPVPREGCQQPTINGPGRDFMTGGLKGQAVVDITAAWLGGYINTNAAGIGGGQDERLMTYMPEVLTLAFFLSQAPGQWPQVRAPAWVLGARKIGVGLDGTCRWDQPLVVDAAQPFTSDIVAVPIGSRTFRISSSMPFVGFYSKNQDWGGIPDQNRRNKDPGQRTVDPQVWYSFGEQVKAYYQALALTSYARELRPAMKRLVQSTGTGPWGAGLWFGDSQVSFIASWIGHAAASKTWGSAGLGLDLYIYSAFTENPSNQCFLHSKENCEACLRRCMQNPLPRSAFWLPEDYFVAPNKTNSCIPARDGDCGKRGLEHIVAAFDDAKAGELWAAFESTMKRHRFDTTNSVFDLLLRRTNAL